MRMEKHLHSDDREEKTCQPDTKGETVILRASDKDARRTSATETLKNSNRRRPCFTQTQPTLRRCSPPVPHPQIPAPKNAVLASKTPPRLAARPRQLPPKTPRGTPDLPRSPDSSARSSRPDRPRGSAAATHSAS